MEDEKVLALLEEGVLLSPDTLETIEPSVEVLANYTKRSQKRTYDHVVSYFNQRFKAISALLRQRQELLGARSISRLKQAKQKENVALIGIVYEKAITKNGNILLTLEDQTGFIKVLFHIRDQELLNLGKDIMLDEVIGITGALGEDIVFANSVIFPDIPIANELKKSPHEEHLVVLGDPEIGGKDFLQDDFEKAIAWLRGEVGSEEQRAMAQKVKYLVLIGDLVAGVGVYPNQEQDLNIKDIKEQYDAFTKYIEQVPSHIQIITIPGNHDAGRLAEPQLPIYKDFAERLYQMPNVTMLSNPSLVRIGKTATFEGFILLLYHGYSIIYYADNVPSIRERGGQKRSELIMKYFLQRRHLAPSHGSNLYIPDPDEDPMFINRIPDIFLTGHIHRVASATYRGVTMVNASAWSDVTEAQERRGLEPEPSRLPVINLQTREVKIINFYTGKMSKQ